MAFRLNDYVEGKGTIWKVESILPGDRWNGSAYIIKCGDVEDKVIYTDFFKILKMKEVHNIIKDKFAKEGFELEDDMEWRWNLKQDNDVVSNFGLNDMECSRLDGKIVDLIRELQCWMKNNRRSELETD